MTTHPSGAAGFVYNAALPEKTIIEEVQAYGSWTCRIPVLNLRPIAAPLHAKMESKIISASVPVGGATLKCIYTTPFEFGAGTELLTDLHSAFAYSA
ncbi:MAG TPA: hypothetical protein DEA55_00830 [Rhodospirillaceae bacterium]|nr:hypothetical protein [Rhodospirillaceae bacterium]